MQITQRYQLDSLEGGNAFIDENTGIIPGAAASGAKKRLAACIEVLNGHEASQSANVVAAQGATKIHYVNRRTLLRDHMAAIAAAARAELLGAPELEVLKMPPQWASVTRLLDSAGKMVVGAAKHEALFIAAGLPADFIAQLQGAIDALKTVLKERKDSSDKSAGATTGIKTTLADARRQVHVLDKLIRTTLKDDPARLKNWEQAIRVRRSPRSVQVSPDAAAASAIATSAVIGTTSPESGVSALPVKPVVSVAA